MKQTQSTRHRTVRLGSAEWGENPIDSGAKIWIFIFPRLLALEW